MYVRARFSYSIKTIATKHQFKVSVFLLQITKTLCWFLHSLFENGLLTKMISRNVYIHS